MGQAGTVARVDPDTTGALSPGNSCSAAADVVAAGADKLVSVEPVPGVVVVGPTPGLLEVPDSVPVGSGVPDGVDAGASLLLPPDVGDGLLTDPDPLVGAPDEPVGAPDVAPVVGAELVGVRTGPPLDPGGDVGVG